MGKRSSFERRERDFYATPPEAIDPLLIHLVPHSTFAEPCIGDGDLAEYLEKKNHPCMYGSDITFGDDALELTPDLITKCDYIITNPPWDRSLLHPMIDHFRILKPTWLLFDADWCHTIQSKPYMKYCRKIVSVGRIKWIAGSKHTGKDNCAWYKFDNTEGNTNFIGR